MNIKNVDDDRFYTTNEFSETIPVLLGVTELGEYLGWDRRKVATYINRDKIPKPSTYVGKRPFWTLKRIEEFTKK